MNIFLSWSGSISQLIAKKFKEMLEDCFYEKVNVFMSSQDISLGTNGINAIFKALIQSEICVLFINPLNMDAPWLTFEAGMVAGSSNSKDSHDKRIIPLLFGNIDFQRFNKNPLHNYQYAEVSLEIINKFCTDIIKHLSYSDPIKAVDQIRPKIQLYYTAMKKIEEQIPGAGLLKSRGFIESLSAEPLFQSSLRGEIAEFENSFETPELYREILKYVDKRLYVFGRKNTKLFSNSNRPFFNDLGRKISNGFDFKCLFLSPESEYVKNAQNDPNFLEHLKDRIKSAKNLLKDDYILETVCKLYKCDRTTAVIIADDVVIFSPITYSANNVPNPLTYSDFFVTDINSEIGKKYVNLFSKTWDNADKISQILNETC